MFEEFNHFFQEAYPTELKKKNELNERNNKSSEMATMKKIARDVIKKNGDVFFPKLNYERCSKYPNRQDLNSTYCAKYPEKDYNMTYNYVDQQIKKFTQNEVRYSVNQQRSTKKNLFDLLGVGHPDEKVLIVNKPSSLGISFSIVRTRQHKLFKRSNNTRFIHFSPQESITKLEPTLQSREFGMNKHVYIYPTTRCYFWAIDIDKIPEKALSYAFETYGRNIYEYNPKPSDRIIVDESDSTRFPGATPVFIETDKSLTVKPVTDEFRNLKQAFEKGDIKSRSPYIFSASEDKRTDDDHVKNICDTLERDFEYKQKQYSRMKETANGKVEKLKMLFDRVKGYIEEIPMMTDSSKSEAKDKYPKAKNLDIFDKVAKVYLKKAKELLKEISDLLKKQGVVVEYFFGPNDDDDTSGTSEFDESYNNDPDDCYCESSIPRSNEVYTNDRSIEKINDFPFDKVYFGSPNKLPTTMELDGPLFISPYPGIASIFSVRPQNLQKYGVPKGIRCNRAYDEWDRSLKDTVLQKPLTELHVRIQGDNIKIKPTTELASGYLYTIDVTPEIRDHIYQSSKMSKVFEFCIDKMDSVTFSNIKKINVRMTVTGEELPQEFKEGYVQEAKLPTSKRNKLPDSDFALVYTDANGKKIRKYPVYDKAHVEAAAKMFPRGIPLKYQKKVAKRILREAHGYDIDTSEWKLNKYK